MSSLPLDFNLFIAADFERLLFASSLHRTSEVAKRVPVTVPVTSGQSVQSSVYSCEILARVGDSD